MTDPAEALAHYEYVDSEEFRSYMRTVRTAGVLDEVLMERFAQHAKWGEQNHPDGTGWNSYPFADTGFNLDLRTGEEAAAQFRDSCERRFADGDGAWRDILLEEVAESLAEDDPVELRAELIQVAAVAVAWVEAIDRRGDA